MLDDGIYALSYFHKSSVKSCKNLWLFYWWLLLMIINDYWWWFVIIDDDYWLLIMIVIDDYYWWLLERIVTKQTLAEYKVIKVSFKVFIFFFFY